MRGDNTFGLMDWGIDSVDSYDIGEPVSCKELDDSLCVEKAFSDEVVEKKLFSPIKNTFKKISRPFSKPKPKPLPSPQKPNPVSLSNQQKINSMRGAPDINAAPTVRRPKQKKTLTQRNQELSDSMGMPHGAASTTSPRQVPEQVVTKPAPAPQSAQQTKRRWGLGKKVAIGTGLLGTGAGGHYLLSGDARRDLA